MFKKYSINLLLRGNEGGFNKCETNVANRARVQVFDKLMTKLQYFSQET